jgi:hypothetical protein
MRSHPLRVASDETTSSFCYFLISFRVIYRFLILPLSNPVPISAVVPEIQGRKGVSPLLQHQFTGYANLA